MRAFTDVSQSERREGRGEQASARAHWSERENANFPRMTRESANGFAEMSPRFLGPSRRRCFPVFCLCLREGGGGGGRGQCLSREPGSAVRGSDEGGQRRRTRRLLNWRAKSPRLRACPSSIAFDVALESCTQIDVDTTTLRHVRSQQRATGSALAAPRTRNGRCGGRIQIWGLFSFFSRTFFFPIVVNCSICANLCNKLLNLSMPKTYLTTKCSRWQNISPRIANFAAENESNFGIEYSNTICV